MLNWRWYFILIGIVTSSALGYYDQAGAINVDTWVVHTPWISSVSISILTLIPMEAIGAIFEGLFDVLGDVLGGMFD